VLIREPVGRAAEMRAPGPERVEALLRTYHPQALFDEPARVYDTDLVRLGRARIEFLRGLVDDVGEEKSSGGGGACAEKRNEGGPTEPQKVPARHLRGGLWSRNLRGRRCRRNRSRVAVCHDRTATLTIRQIDCQESRSMQRASRPDHASDFLEGRIFEMESNSSKAPRPKDCPPSLTRTSPVMLRPSSETRNSVAA